MKNKIITILLLLIATTIFSSCNKYKNARCITCKFLNSPLGGGGPYYDEVCSTSKDFLKYAKDNCEAAGGHLVK